MSTKLFDAFILSRGDEISDKTKQTYKSNYERLLKIMGKKKLVHTYSQQALLDKIEEYDGDKISILKTLCQIYAFKKGTANVLQDRRREMENEYMKTQHDRNKTLTDTLISYDRLMDIVTGSKEKNMNDYVLFKLIIDLNCRNMDLIAKIVNKDDEMDDKHNYVIIDGDDVKYVRNSYKTMKTYGQKINNIDDEDMKKYCKDNIGKHLFETRNGKPYNNVEIGNVVLRQFGKYEKSCKLNQQNVFKILKRRVDQSNDLHGAEQLCENRGHSMDTSVNYYRSVEPVSNDDYDINELD